MKIDILVFGMLTDKFGRPEIQMENVYNLDMVIDKLRKKYDLNDEVKFAVARNGEIVKGNIHLNDGDEIALLPSYAGG